MSRDTISPARPRERYSLRSFHSSSTISRTSKRSKTSPSKLSSPSSHQKSVNCMQKASQKTSQKHVTVKKVKATPREKAKRKNKKSSPCPLQPVTRSSSDSPQPPSMHTSSPSTAAKCMTGQELSHRGRSLRSKISLPCVRIPRWGIPDNAPVRRSVSKRGIQRILRSHVSKGWNWAVPNSTKRRSSTRHPVHKSWRIISWIHGKSYTQVGQFNETSGGRC